MTGKESLIEKLKEIMNYAGSCAEGPTDPEFTQFIAIEADLKAIISHLESKAAQLPKEVDYETWDCTCHPIHRVVTVRAS